MLARDTNSIRNLRAARSHAACLIYSFAFPLEAYSVCLADAMANLDCGLYQYLANT